MTPHTHPINNFLDQPQTVEDLIDMLRGDKPIELVAETERAQAYIPDDNTYNAEYLAHANIDDALLKKHNLAKDTKLTLWIGEGDELIVTLIFQKEIIQPSFFKYGAIVLKSFNYPVFKYSRMAYDIMCDFIPISHDCTGMIMSEINQQLLLEKHLGLELSTSNELNENIETVIVNMVEGALVALQNHLAEAIYQYKVNNKDKYLARFMNAISYDHELESAIINHALKITKNDMFNEWGGEAIKEWQDISPLIDVKLLQNTGENNPDPCRSYDHFPKNCGYVIAISTGDNPCLFFAIIKESENNELLLVGEPVNIMNLTTMHSTNIKAIKDAVTRLTSMMHSADKTPDELEDKKDAYTNFLCAAYLLNPCDMLYYTELNPPTLMRHCSDLLAKAVNQIEAESDTSAPLLNHLEQLFKDSDIANLNLESLERRILEAVIDPSFFKLEQSNEETQEVVISSNPSETKHECFKMFGIQPESQIILTTHPHAYPSINIFCDKTGEIGLMLIDSVGRLNPKTTAAYTEWVDLVNIGINGAELLKQFIVANLDILECKDTVVSERIILVLRCIEDIKRIAQEPSSVWLDEMIDIYQQRFGITLERKEDAA